MYPAALPCIQARLMRDYITGYSSHATHPVLLWQPLVPFIAPTQIPDVSYDTGKSATGL